MKSAFIKKSLASTSFNIWRIKLDGDCYLISPAHGFIQKGSLGEIEWNKKLDGKLKSSQWRINPGYSPYMASNLTDLVWVKCEPKKNEHEFLEVKPEVSTFPFKVDLFTNQPFNIKAQKNLDSYFAGLHGVIYPGGLGLYEILGVGYHGMSGAAVVEENTTSMIGIYLKRAYYLPIRDPIKKNQSENKNSKIDKFHVEEKETVSSNAFIENGNSSSNQGNETPSEIPILEDDKKFTRNSEFGQILKILNNMTLTLDSHTSILATHTSKLNDLTDKLDKLDKEVLKHSHLKEIENSQALRRSIVMPSNMIRSLILEKKSILVEDYLQKKVKNWKI